MKYYIIFVICFFSSNTLFTQRVQLSGLPGQDDSMNISDMLNQIMAPYYDELTNLNNNKVNKEIEYQLWQDFKTNIEGFERVNKYMMGYESAFRSVTNEVSDPSSLAVKTTKSAKKGEYLVTIKNLASAHSLATAPISINKEIVGGIFNIITEQNTNTINFKGGTLSSLVSELGKKTSKELDIKVLNASADAKIMSIMSKKSGKNSQIQFEGDIAPLLDIKLLTKGKEKKTNIYWFEDQDKYLILTNSNHELAIDYPILNKTTLSFNSKLFEIPIEEQKQTNNEEISLSELNIQEIGSITNQNIILPGARPILEDFQQTNTNQISTNTPIQELVLYFNDDSQTNISLSKDTHIVSLEPFKEKTLSQMKVLSENKIAEISSLTLTETPEGALVPHNETAKAEDAAFLLDGLEINRASNTINDLITGVTLDLLQENRTNIRITIKPDLELIKDTIIQWVMNYNQIMEEIHTFTTISLDQIGQIKPLYKRLEDDEDLKAGTFYGNTSLTGFKDRLRRMMSSAYGTNPNSLSLLDQIGIYTRRRSGANTDPDALRKGTLTLDISELEEKLNEDIDVVRHLFMTDTDGDSLPDRGIVISAIDTLKIMIGGNGYLTRIEQNNSRTMKDMSTRITKKEEQIENTERKERQALLQMNQAIIQSKSLSESLQQRLR